MLKRQCPRLLVLFVLVSLYMLARPTTIAASERESLARRFAFASVQLPDVPGPPVRYIRPVNPALKRVQSWISAVGASVALSDIDGDGLPNDACYVDTRTNQVIVAPVPQSPASAGQAAVPRYAAFALDLDAVPHGDTIAPMGCLAGNFAESGATDLLVYFWGAPPAAFLHRSDAGALGKASFVAQPLVAGRERWYSNAATMADVDGDGHLDLIIGNYFPDWIRLLDAHATDGATMQHSMSRAFNGGGPRLLMWTGASQGRTPSAHYRLADDAWPSDVRGGWTLAVGAADFDDDLLPEMYLANDFGPDRMLANRSTPGHPSFALTMGRRDVLTPKSKTVGHDSYKGMGIEFADLMGRGRLDMFVSNITSEYALEESNFAFINTGDRTSWARRTAPFKDRSEELGLSRGGWCWDVKLADFDNAGSLQMIQAAGFVHGRVDRWPELQELAMANDQALRHPQAWPRIGLDDDLNGSQHNPFFVRAANGIFYDVAPEIGLEPGDKTAPSRGIAIADADGDGKLDFAVANQWGATVFYQNRSPTRNRSVALRLRQPLDARTPFRVVDGVAVAGIASRPAIGAEAILAMPGGGYRLAQVDGGNGHSGKRSPDIHFGVGAVPADTVLSVVIRWRDGRGIHRQRISVTPGIHTVVLGSTA